jgi:hypothetical protein
MHRNFRGLGFLSLLWEWKYRRTPAAEVGKILFVEKRRERLHGGECRGTQKPVVPWVGLGIGFYSLFDYCMRAEMSLRCRQKFPGKEKCLLSQISPLGTSYSPSFRSCPKSCNLCPSLPWHLHEKIAHLGPRINILSSSKTLYSFHLKKYLKLREEFQDVG